MIGIKLPDAVIEENGHFKKRDGDWKHLKNEDGWMLYFQNAKAKSKLLTTSIQLQKHINSLSDEDKEKFEYKDNSLETVMLLMAHLGKGALEWPMKKKKKLPSYLVFQMENELHMLSYCPDDCNPKARMTYSSLQMHIVPLLSLPEKTTAKCHVTEYDDLTDRQRMIKNFNEHYKKVPKRWTGEEEDSD